MTTHTKPNVLAKDLQCSECKEYRMVFGCMSSDFRKNGDHTVHCRSCNAISTVFESSPLCSLDSVAILDIENRHMWDIGRHAKNVCSEVDTTEAHLFLPKLAEHIFFALWSGEKGIRRVWDDGRLTRDYETENKMIDEALVKMVEILELMVSRCEAVAV